MTRSWLPCLELACSPLCYPLPCWNDQALLITNSPLSLSEIWNKAPREAPCGFKLVFYWKRTVHWPKKGRRRKKTKPQWMMQTIGKGGIAWLSYSHVFVLDLIFEVGLWWITALATYSSIECLINDSFYINQKISPICVIHRADQKLHSPVE